MLKGVRSLFDSTSGDDTQAIHGLITRILIIQSPCAEALFWRGLCFVREGRSDLALTSLQAAREATEGRVLDPLLYLGVLLLRQGDVQEALKYLSEANRLE